MNIYPEFRAKAACPGEKLDGRTARCYKARHNNSSQGTAIIFSRLAKNLQQALQVLGSRAAHVWRRRNLIAILVRRDLVARYRSSALGFLWSLLHPLMLMGIYTLVFQFYMRIEWRQPYPYALYLLVGLLPWNWLASSMSEGSNSILGGGSMVRTVSFPAEVLPLVTVLANGFHFLLGLGILCVVMIVAGYPPSAEVLLLPLVAALQFLFVFGLALLLAGATVFFRDIQHLLVHVITMWFFLTPILYTTEHVAAVPRVLRLLFYVNPMAPIILAYQSLLVFKEPPNLYMWSWAALSAVGCFLVGFFVFQRLRESLAEGIV